jgi:D-alanine-D-alanine ligase
MKIGITYDSKDFYKSIGYSEYEIAEFDKESTIENIENTLQQLGHHTIRIGNINNLLNKIYNGDKWDMVFNICEGIHGTGREAQVPALLDAYQIPYAFSDPLVLSLTLNKGITKRIIRDAGIKTESFTIIKNEEDIKNIELSYPLFVKPNSEGSGKGISLKSKVNNNEELIDFCKNIWLTLNCELIVEKYLPGREFTVGILGSNDESVSLGCMEINFSSDEKFYSYNMKENYKEFIKYTLPEKEITDKVCELALKSWKVLGCKDAGRVDIRLDDNGEPNFIEVNPLAGLNKETSDLPILAKMNGFSYEYIIENIINSTKKRYNL